MASLVKYRVHEVAKDFGMNSKTIAEILKEYATAPKNHMQVLEEAELNIVFEYLTRHNQIDSIEEVFADAGKKPEPKTEPVAVKPEATAPVQPAATVANETVKPTWQPLRPNENVARTPSAPAQAPPAAD